MDWDKLKIFHAVAEAGSFTNATINLNLSQSAISRQIEPATARASSCRGGHLQILRQLVTSAFIMHA